MNKLKTTFLRSHSTRQPDERRSLQFARKLNAAQLAAFDDPNTPSTSPSLRPDELSEMERIAYQTWWKDLDPFSIGHLDTEALLKFVRGCCLPNDKLEQILAFFQDGKEGGLDEHQFYALLRLIAHAQNGRTVSRDMVFLGAPVPRFKTNAIDALIKPAADLAATTAPHQQPAGTTATAAAKSTSEFCGGSTAGSASWQLGTQATRNSWIQPSPRTNHPAPAPVARQQQQQQQRPTSWYVGQQPAAPVYDPAPSAPPFLSPPVPIAATAAAANRSHSPFHQQPQEPSTAAKHGFGSSGSADSYSSNASVSAAGPGFSWPQLPAQPSQQPMSHSSTTISGRSSEQKHPYTHSRSRSVPYSVPQPTHAQPDAAESEHMTPSVFMFDTVAATPSKQQQQQRPPPLASRMSMDADSFQRLSSAIDTGQSLLLTKRFVPPKASNNPFESAIDESPKRDPSSASYSPFADDLDNEDAASTPRASASFPANEPPPPALPQASAPPWPGVNQHPNKQNVYPPPVPSQATKPAFPKYARNMQPLRRTQSYRSSSRLDDPFSTADPTTTPLQHTTTTPNTAHSPIAFSHGNKLFRHRSDGSALMRR